MLGIRLSFSFSLQYKHLSVRDGSSSGQDFRAACFPAARGSSTGFHFPAQIVLLVDSALQVLLSIYNQCQGKGPRLTVTHPLTRSAQITENRREGGGKWGKGIYCSAGVFQLAAKRQKKTWWCFKQTMGSDSQIHLLPC